MQMLARLLSEWKYGGRYNNHTSFTLALSVIRLIELETDIQNKYVFESSKLLGQNRLIN